MPIIKYAFSLLIFLRLSPTIFSSGAFFAACLGAFLAPVTAAGALTVEGVLFTGDEGLGGDFANNSLAAAGAGRFPLDRSGDMAIGVTGGREDPMDPLGRYGLARGFLGETSGDMASTKKSSTDE